MVGEGGGKRPTLQEFGSELDEVRRLLFELSTRFRKAQALATAVAANGDLCREVADRGRQLVEAARLGERDGGSTDLVGRLEEELKAGPAAFESRRVLLEGPKGTSFVWHGPTSLQRIVLQDERFVEATREPEAALLLVAMVLSQGGELSALLLGALHSKLLLGYMATASPNWESLPRLRGVAWDMAYAFVQHERLAEESSVQITPELLRRRLRSAEHVANALTTLAEGCEHAASVGCDEELEASLRASAEAPLQTLLAELRVAAATPAQAASLARGPSGASTDLYPMICQSLAVMAHFGAASAAVGSTAATMSLGAFSHALDAKHLLALLHALQRWPPEAEFPGRSFGAFLREMPEAAAGGSGPNPEGRGLRGEQGALEDELRAGLAEVRELLRRCREGAAEPLEAELLLCRLRQARLLQAAARAPSDAFVAAGLRLAAGGEAPDGALGSAAELIARSEREPDVSEAGPLLAAIERVTAELRGLPSPGKVWLLLRGSGPAVVGCAVVHAGEEGAAVLSHLCLEAGLRGQGLGQALYEVAERWVVAERSFGSFRAAPRCKQSAAVELCERNGLLGETGGKDGWRVKGLHAAAEGAPDKTHTHDF